MSDGYQSIAVMAVNIIMGVVDRWREIDLAEGVVLVDELEVHLHPKWKMEIVSLLRQVFPKMTFLVTTHDPLCLRGLNPGEIVVLKRDETGLVPTVVRESIAHLRADQLLTSPLFGLLGTRDPAAVNETEKLGQEYDALFVKEHRAPAEEARLQELRAQIVQLTPASESPEGRFAEVAVQMAVQEMTKEPVSSRPDSLVNPALPPEVAKAAIRRKVEELLHMNPA